MLKKYTVKLEYGETAWQKTVSAASSRSAVKLAFPSLYMRLSYSAGKFDWAGWKLLACKPAQPGHWNYTVQCKIQDDEHDVSIIDCQVNFMVYC